mmetsp:Transcript_827/g.1865  ORF Transcript_827/g.1865 Transcript_827/m.1865 type:complete len:86 (+) Transcript_827:507-764(+)
MLVIQEAESYGVDNAMTSGEYNQGPISVLRSLPGIDSRNIGRVVAAVESISELAQLSLEKLQELLGVANGRALHRFLNNSAPLLV